MKFVPTMLKGAYILEMELIRDSRGFFTRSFCKSEMEDHGLESHFPQGNTSWNEKKNTLRGMHSQAEPHSEVKIIRCTRGRIYDVIVDIRPDSPTYCKWFGIELSANDYRMLYIPKGFLHGYQTLEPDTETTYMVSAYYAPGAERSARWNDPAFNIKWPLPDPILSPKDAAHPDFKP